MAEDYVRPPLLAREAPSRRAAAIRFWLTFAVLLAAVIVGIFLLYRLATGGGGEGNPTFNQGAAATAPAR